MYMFMVILRTRDKITDFLMILSWASPFKYRGNYVKIRNINVAVLINLFRKYLTFYSNLQEK